MRSKWEESDNPVLQVAAYKLLAEDDELVRLTSNKHEVTGKNGEPLKTEHKHIVEFRDFTNANNSELQR